MDTITGNYNILILLNMYTFKNDTKVSWKSLGQGNKPTLRVKYGITLLVPIVKPEHLKWSVY